MRKIELSFDNRSEVIVLPINPQSIELKDPQLNQRVQLLSIGEANLLGDRGLSGLTLASFFPSARSPHYKRASRTPSEYISMLKKWKESGKPIRLIISDININLAMSIDELTTTQNEGDSDINYSLTLTEYRSLNVPSVKVDTTVKASIKTRPAPPPPAVAKANTGGTSYTIKGGDTLWAIAVRQYGNGSQYPKIYEANKDAIESAAQARGKASSDNGHWIWAGTVLVLP